MRDDSHSKERKRARGAYYSPRPIADYIVERTIAPLLVGKSPRQAATLRIVDPACGAGVFLLSAYEYLLRWHREQYLADADSYSQQLQKDATGQWQLAPRERLRILRECIYGVDIEPQAVAETRRALCSAASVDGLDSELLQHNIQCADALLGADWPRSFSEVFQGPCPGFDAVIGNPPWISLSGKFGAGGYSVAEVEYLIKRYDGNTYLPNLYEYFIALALELIRPGGHIGYIVPDRLGHNDQFIALRKKLLLQTTILSLLYAMPFPKVVADSLIFVLRKEPASTDHVVQLARYGEAVRTCRQSDLLRRPKHVLEAAAFESFIEKINTQPNIRRIYELFDSTSGFGGKSQLIEARRSSRQQLEVMKGDSVGRYQLRKTYWFDFQKQNLTGRTTDLKKLGAAPKILLRKTGDRIIATYDDSNRLPEQSLYFLFNKKYEISYKYVLGILNSSLLTRYFRAVSLTNRGSIAQVKKKDLDQLPLPVPDLHDASQKQLHDTMVTLVDTLLLLHAQLQTVVADDARATLQQQIALAEHKIDQLTRTLYALPVDPMDPLKERAT